MSSTKSARPGFEKNMVAAVVLVAAFFMALGAVLGLWNARKMRAIVSQQFNEEQHVIARNLAERIEREFSLLRKEILLIGKSIRGGTRIEACNEHVQQSLARVLESGVSEIEIIDSESRTTHHLSLIHI